MRRARRDRGSGRGRASRALLTVLVTVVGVLFSAALAAGTQPNDTYQSTVSGDSPVARYRLDDPSGSSTIADSAGSDTATNHGVALGAGGPFAGSKSGLFGSSGYASLASNPLSGASAFSAEAWLSWVGGTNYKQAIFDFGSSSTNYMYLTPASALTGHKALFEIHTGGGSTAQVTATKLPVGPFEYIAVTETTGGTLTLYLNGEQVGQVTGVTLNPSSLGSLTSYYIGKSLAGDPNLEGWLSNVAFYNAALSATQIQAHYNAAEFPVNTILPTVSGMAKDGSNLTAHAETWTGRATIKFTYLWERCNGTGGECVETAAHEKTYPETSADIGHTMRVKVTGENGSGQSSATSATIGPVIALKPVNSSLPTISGTPKVAKTLTAHTGGWAGASPPTSYTYQWRECNNTGASCKNLTGATAETYRPEPAQTTDTLRVVVTASNSGGSTNATSEATPPIEFGEPVNFTTPAVSGTAQDEQPLTASQGTWGGSGIISYTYHWQRCESSGEGCADIGGATSPEYKIEHIDVGHELRIRVAAQNVFGTVSEESSTTTVVIPSPPSIAVSPAISGTPEARRTVTSSSGTWKGTPPLTYSYQWESCSGEGEEAGCIEIPGATGVSYTANEGDVGARLRVTVTASNVAGSSVDESSLSAPVAPAPRPIFSGQFGEEGPEAGQFNHPAGVVLAPNGHLLVVDEGDGRVEEFTQAGEYLSQFGSEGSGSAQLSEPSGIAVDSHGDIWVTDAGNARVQEFSESGEHLRTVGSGELGSAENVAVDQHDNIWVSDPYRGRLVVFKEDGEHLISFDVPGAGAAPEGLTIDSSGDVWVVDRANDRVDVLNEAGELLKQFGGEGSGSGEFEEPYAVAIDSEEEVLVADVGNDRVEEFNESGEYLGELDAQGFEPGYLRLSVPTGIATAPSGHVWITDSENNRVEQWDPGLAEAPANTTLPSLEGNLAEGDYLFASDGSWSGSQPFEFSYQWQACDAAGVSCHDIEGAERSAYQLQAADVGGTIRVIVTAANSAGAAATPSTASAPITAATAPSDETPPTIEGTPSDGQALTVDTGSWTGDPFPELNPHWQRCDTAGEECADIPGATSYGYELAPADVGSTVRVVVSATNPGGSAEASSAPSAVVEAQTPALNTAPVVSGIAEEGVQLTATKGTWHGTPTIAYSYQWQTCAGLLAGCLDISGATSSSYTPTASDVGSDVRVVVTASNVGGETAAASASTAEVAPGHANVSQVGEAGAGAGQLDQPEDLATDAGGDLWVLDTLNSRVVEYSAQGTYIKQFGSEGSGKGELLRPTGIALDAQGDIWIAEALNARVQEFSSTGTYLKVIGSGELLTPEGLAVDAAGNVWIADAGHKRLYMYNESGEQERSVGSIGEPKDVAVDAAGHLWVTDWTGNKVRELSSTGSLLRQFGTSGTGNGQFTHPYGVTAARGRVWIGDAGNNRVEEFDEEGHYLSHFGSVGSGAGEFSWGQQVIGMGLAVEPDGGVWVTDAHRLQRWDPQAIVAPSSSTAPQIAGSPGEFEVLKASSGAWSGPPSAYEYQWQRCEGSEASCADIEEATTSSYMPQTADVGSELRVVVTAIDTHGSASAASSLTVVVASAPAESSCTDHWIALEDGDWGSEADWSTGSVPGPGDVACIPAGLTATVAAGSYSVGAVQGAGQIVIDQSGSLALTSSEDSSSLGVLRIEDGTLSGAGNLTVSGSLYWAPSGEMSGSGTTTLASSAQSSIELGVCPTHQVVLAERKLINEGLLRIASGNLLLTDGAALENDGTLLDNAQRPSSGEPCAKWSIFQDPSSGGAAASVLNNGTFAKTAGTGLTDIGVGFTNLGKVSAESGEFRFDDGSVTEQVSSGSWTADSGASLIFGHGEAGVGGGTFLLSQDTSLSAVTILSGTTVIRDTEGAPAPVSVPSISGEALEGASLTASEGDWRGERPLTYAYQWRRCDAMGAECSDVEGATAATYSLGVEDVGATLRVVVTASNGEGSENATSSPTSMIAAITSPSDTAAPALAGLAQVGQALSANPGTWVGPPAPTLAYQWELCNAAGEACAAIESATGLTYEPNDDELGKTVKLLVTATNAAGSTEASSAASAVIEAEPAGEAQAPSITGPAAVHGVLSAHAGAWTGTARTIAYQWEHCDSTGAECAAIAGATEALYGVPAEDLGDTVRVRIGAGSSQDALSDVSPASPVIVAAGTLASETAPAISGTMQSDSSLSAEHGAWSTPFDTSYTYQWQSCDADGEGCEDIEGARATTFTPRVGYIGSALRIVVTASDGESSVSRASAATQPIARAHSPQIETPPGVVGPALAGSTLQVSPGTWIAHGPLGFAYQWKRCGGEAGCSPISGATSSSYTPTSSDLGHTLLVAVTAADGAGSAFGTTPETPVIEPEALTKLADPSIAGIAQTGGVLRAEPGVWSGKGPVAYAYQWQHCNAAGAECAAIEAATGAEYTLGEGGPGPTVRVSVSATGPLGSTSAVSAFLAATTGGSASIEEVEEAAQHTDSSLLAASTEASVEGQPSTPGLEDTEEGVLSRGTLTSSTISKQAAGEFAVNTPDGELSVIPAETAAAASAAPTIVNEAAAVFANTQPATDTIIRANALGAVSVLQLRSAEAPTSFSWQVQLGTDQTLRQLPDGRIAVTTVSEAQPQANEVEPESHESGEGAPESPAEEEEAAAEEAKWESEPEAEVPAEPLPAASPASLSRPEPTAGSLQFDDTQLQYEVAQNSSEYSESQTEGKTLMAIDPPKAIDSTGAAVPSSLTVSGNTITMTLDPGAEAKYPILAAVRVWAPSDEVSASRDPFEYGLSDQRPETFAIPAGEKTFDDNLTGAGTPLEIKTARLIVPYDVTVSSVEAREKKVQQTEKANQEKEIAEGHRTALNLRPTEKQRLVKWLQAVAATHLQPYVTFGQDKLMAPKCTAEQREKQAKEKHILCKLPSIPEYRAAIKKLIKNFHLGSSAEKRPAITLWSSWNEPDNGTNAAIGNATRAGNFWQTAQSVAAELHCGCKVVAGEFAAYEEKFEKGYAQRYFQGLSKYCEACWIKKKNVWKEHAKPGTWGFHDYKDVVHRNNHDAMKFAEFTKGIGKPRLWIGEAGVELQSGESASTELTHGCEVAESKCTTADFEFETRVQKEAAADFLTLHAAAAPKELSRYDRVYYYQDNGALPAENAFDSGLRRSDGTARVAYCYLAYANHKCPAGAD